MEIWTYGQGTHGQLLNFGPIDRWTKADIGTMLLNEKFSCVAGGTYHFLLLSENSRLYGAGDNTYGQLCSPDRIKDSQNKLISIPHEMGRIDEVQAGGYYNIFSCNYGADFYVCGYNQSGDCGLGSLPNTHTPVKIQGELGEELRSGKRISHICAGYYFSYVVLDGNDVFSAGESVAILRQTQHNEYHRVSHDALQVFKKSRIEQIKAGFRYIMFLTADGSLYASGDNSNQQLGISSNNTATLTKVALEDSWLPANLIASHNSYFNSGFYTNSGKIFMTQNTELHDTGSSVGSGFSEVSANIAHAGESFQFCNSYTATFVTIDGTKLYHYDKSVSFPSSTGNLVKRISTYGYEVDTSRLNLSKGLREIIGMCAGYYGSFALIVGPPKHASASTHFFLLNKIRSNNLFSDLEILTTHS